MIVPSQDRFDVIGIGNAMVDMISRVDERFVADQSLIKGSMNLIDEDRAEELSALLTTEAEAAGGSVANTMAGLASFGSAGAFVGKVRDDRLGRVFIDDMERLGVSFVGTAGSSGPMTGCCLILVTPDAQRTLNTYLGISSLLEATDVIDQPVQQASVLFCEGYLWDMSCSILAMKKAINLARRAGRKVAFTLSDTFCVERHHRDFLDLVAGPVDILFANHEELKVLYDCPMATAVERARADVELACITLGADGSWLITPEETIEIEPASFGATVDTTGAGDQYAAGVLHGLCSGLSLREAGRLGSLAAGEVVSHLGPRPHRPLTELIPLLDEMA